MPAPCPSHDDLQHFSLGRVPEGQALRLEEHLARCPTCLETIQGLRAEDTLVEAVRVQAASREKLPGGEAVVRTIGRLRGLQESVRSRHLAVEQLVGLLAPPLAADELGRLGPYRILEVVGTGGMGVVYRAHDPQLDRVVAVKAMLPALAVHPTARERFLREARAAAKLTHDHVVTVYQVGEDRGVPYLAMPFLKGESLEGRLRRLGGPLGVAEALRIGREIAEGLRAMHELGLVHRDVKPANVFLEGETGRVKILDFGLARASADVQLTVDGVIVGTPAFMAPEQGTRGPIDARADLFSLGCVLYTLLTATLPFDGEDVVSTLLAVRTTTPPPPHEKNAAVPEEVSALVMALLAKMPGDRPESAQAVAGRVRELERSTGA